MKTIELKGCFRNVKVFYNGSTHEHTERSEGNEIKSIIIETDNDFSLMEWKDALSTKGVKE